MPSLAPIVLKDGKATPLDHTFKPRGIDGGVATLVESAGTPLGENRLTLSQNRGTNGRIRVIAKIAAPVVQDATVNGITKPTVVRTSYVDITFNFDASSSIAERQDVVAFVNSLTAKTLVAGQQYFVDLEGMY